MVVEDGQDLRGAPVADHAVRGHGVETGRPAGFDENVTVSQPEPDRAFQDIEPVTAGMYP